MFSIGLLSLICALTSGVFGFGVDAPPTWTCCKVSFVIFLLVAAVLFMSSECRRPSLMWAVFDDVHEKWSRTRLTPFVGQRRKQASALKVRNELESS